MRILHVFDHSLPLQSGYVSRSLSIIRGQRSQGWDTIHVTTPRHLVSKASVETIDGLTFHRSPKVGASGPVIRELLEMRATRRTLNDIVLTHKPDLLHAHSPVLNSLPAMAIGKKFGLPVVYEVRALWEDAAVDLGHTSYQSLRYRASRSLDTYVLSRVDKVIALCNPLREEIMARGIAGDRIIVVPNAVDHSFLTPPTPPDGALLQELGIGDQLVLGFVGSFYAYEGLDLLLETVPILSHLIPNFIILLVGGGPEEGRLRSMVEQSGFGRFVRFTGRVHHEEVARYYGIIDICVFPRRKIRLTDLVTPLKPLEAMARFKPIVASDVGGHRELITDSKTGFLFPAGDVNALAALLAEVIRNPIDAARVAASGRNHVETCLNWDVVVQRYGSLYEELLGKNR
jgi:PEP-CTERM/exosortase A-associated glycosyltransferase